jgi:hypothetical protein
MAAGLATLASSDVLADAPWCEMPGRSAEMTRLILAAAILAVAAMPAYACDYMKKSVTADTQSSTVASQPSNDQAQSTPSDGKS